LLALNSPLNPTGTVFDAEQLAAICDLVLEENARRRAGERPLYVMYDQVYWMITAGGVTHVDPVTLRPAIAPYVIFVDAISKAFAATGLRVGWAAGPADVIKPMADILTHVGAWAPRAEQVATARLLSDHASVDRYVNNMRHEAAARLDAVHDGLTAMQQDGFPVECIRPQGAIYVSGRFALHGMRTPSGELLETDEDVRRYILRAANLAAVPFGAFGVQHDRGGWFRLSIGVVSVAQIEAVFPPLRRALETLVGNEVATRG
jgi:aspartate aminotransferase